MVDLDGQLIRMQVKSARAPRASKTNQLRPTYVFEIRRAGKGGKRRYGSDEFDLVACVALDLWLIAYVPEAVAMQHVQVAVPGWESPERTPSGMKWRAHNGRQFADLTFAKAVANLPHPPWPDEDEYREDER